MGFFRQVMGASLSVADPAGWGGAWLGTTHAGVAVSHDTALKQSVVWACVRLLSETIASLPLKVYRRLPGGGRREATNHPLWDLLDKQPNRYQTAIEFRQMMTAHTLLRGNGLAKLVSGPRGFVDEMIPLHPDCVQFEHTRDGNLRYRYTPPDGAAEVLTDDQVLHVKGMAFDWLEGVSVITYARESIGLDLAAEAYGARFFGNGAEPRGVLQAKGTLGEEAQKNLTESWHAAHSGANQHRVAVLEEGVEYKPVGLSNKDSQFLELREFQAEDACRWFGVPPHMVGLKNVSSWGTGIEQLGQAFVTYTLMPWLQRWEQAITRDLIIAPDTYFVEHVTAALLRGDLVSRYSAYQIGRNIGVMSPNEIRRLENMNPRSDPGGDVYAENVPGGAPNRGRVEPPGGEDAHYRELVEANAGRVVRKEVAALSKAVSRDAMKWIAAQEAFYAGHAAYVAEVMCLPLDAVQDYVNAGRDGLVDAPPDDWNEWAARRTAALVALVLEAE